MTPPDEDLFEDRRWRPRTTRYHKGFEVIARKGDRSPSDLKFDVTFHGTPCPDFFEAVMLFMDALGENEAALGRYAAPGYGFLGMDKPLGYLRRAALQGFDVVLAELRAEGPR